MKVSLSNRKREKSLWENFLDLGYGINLQGNENNWIKTDDKIDFTSKYGYTASKNWSYSALFNFKTQFSDGYNYPNDSIKISGLFAPAYILESIGMDFQSESGFSCYFSPATIKITVVGNQELANIGAFGVQKATLDNNGNIIVPWYNGERTPDIPEACPIYFGFQYEEINKKSIARGLIEGHVLNLFAGFSKMPVKPDIIHLTGGLSHSKSWCQMIADIFDCETVPVKGEGAALGAAIHAAWVWKNENGLSCDLAQLVNPFIIFEEGLRCKPNKKNVKIYQNLFLSYEALVKRVLGLEGSDPFKLRKEFFLS